MNHYRIFSIAMICVLLATSANAQQDNKVAGTINVGGGYGTTAPWEGNVRLVIPAGKVRITPFAGIQGIIHKSSEVLDDRTFNYASSKNTYTSTQMLESSGVNMQYGISALIPTCDKGKLNIHFTGSNLRQNTSGTMTDHLTNANNNNLGGYHWTVDMPDLKQDQINAGADYSYGDFRIGYSYRHEKVLNTLNMDTYIVGGPIPSYHRNTDTRWNDHKAYVAYDIKPAKGQMITLGLNYENDQVEREHQQNVRTVDGKNVNENPTFKHQLQSGSASVAYRYGSRVFRAMARLEYSYTHLKNDVSSNNLNDLTPIAHLDWSVGKSDTIAVDYRMIIRRPDIDRLDPTRIYGSYTEDFGNTELKGIHINNISLAYRKGGKYVDFATTFGAIIVEDGFNAIWMEKENIRISFWGNEAVRRAYSIAPQLRWRAAEGTTINARATVMWDKRIARAISMAKEHWGVTAELGLNQKLPYQMSLSVNGRYSEGNMIDLYSHEARGIMAGAAFSKGFMHKHKLTLSYDYQEYANAIITQGQYTGEIDTRPGSSNTIRLSAIFKI